MHMYKTACSLMRVKKLAVILLSVSLMILLIIVPEPVLAGARNGLMLCGGTIIPSLYPFLVLSSFVIGSGAADSCGRLLEPLTRYAFNLPGSAGAALFLGAIGGYPVGADAVSKLCANGSLSKKESERLLCFAINSSPAFIIGAVGAGFFHNTQTGMILYAAHILASFSIGFILRFASKSDSRRKCAGHHIAGKSDNLSLAFVKSVTGSAESIITICAFVVIFSALNSLLNCTGAITFLSSAVSAIIPPPPTDAQFYSRAAVGILEVTNGCAAASGSVGFPAVLLASSMLGFSGLSVQFQVIALIKQSGLSAKLFIATRFLHMLLSTALSFVLFNIFPSAIPENHVVSAIALNPCGFSVSFHSIPAVCGMLFIIAILLLSLVKV